MTETLSLFNWVSAGPVAWSLGRRHSGALVCCPCGSARLRPAARAPQAPAAVAANGRPGTPLHQRHRADHGPPGNARLAEPGRFVSVPSEPGCCPHWSQNQSVAFYPTHILNQLYLPPWAEYAALQVMLLGGDYRLAQLVQWFSMLGSLACASLIALELGASPRGQLFSAFFPVMLPMGILQVLSTQNDYVVAFWLVCLS